MSRNDWFEDLPEDFEESVRIDRQDTAAETHQHRLDAIESYHVTEDSARFIEDFIERLLGRADDMRTGSNYWLYGYYGSGKSHLLTVLDGLMDSAWLEGQDDLWEKLASEDDIVPGDGHLSDLREHWEAAHDEYHVIPVPVNLLNYQGQRERSFSEIVLTHAHQNPRLTNVDGGLSSQIDVAYFEDWYQTTPAWDERRDRTKRLVDELVPATPRYDWNGDEADPWADIQRYSALADVTLPRLFEDVTGTRDGYTDLQPSDIDPEEVISRLESLRRDRQEELGESVKLVLLLDEVGLFIGTDFEHLTELQTLAENVDDIGRGNIQLVATAQAQIEDVQPQFAAHGADFSIVKDRFPHRYPLPSKHVGEIAKRRFLDKTPQGADAVERLLEDAAVKPGESLVYNEVKQNTKPPLDEIRTRDELVEFYPFLPYHAPIFLEILSNLRRDARDPAKSVFSGTARTILALMHRLLINWVHESPDDSVITLVDLFDLIEPELREMLPEETRVIEGRSDTDEDGGIEGAMKNPDSDIRDFDLKVAKALLLLKQVHEIAPLTEGNLAVGVMGDLNGRSWISTTNRVEESLGRLRKFVRPAREDGEPRYRFATQEERTIYSDTEANEEDPDWDAVVETLDDHLWDRIITELSLPKTVPYGESSDEYPVSYHFSLDGTTFETTHLEDGGIDVAIDVQGVHPNASTAQVDEETLYWEIDTDGLEDLRKHLVEWWALRDAIATHEVPTAVEHDLDERSDAVVSKLVSAMSSGSFTVKDRTDIRGLATAVQTAVNVAYPDDFHPMLLQVDEDRLGELRELGSDDPLPTWTWTIQVPSSNEDATQGKRTIQRNVLSLTGRQLKGKDDGLALSTVLDGIVEQKPFYEDARPALRAILWGFCRNGRLLPIDEDGETLADEVVLQSENRATVRLKLLPRDPIDEWLREGGYLATTETVADGLIRLRDANQRVRSWITSLKEEVQLVADTDIQSIPVTDVVTAFADVLDDHTDAATDRLSIIRSQEEGIEGAITETSTAEDWIEEVTDVWERRLDSLYHLDAVLTIGDRRFEWIDERTADALEARSSAVSSFDGEWWTDDGWRTFSGVLSPDLAGELDRAWKLFVDEQDLRTLVDRITDHPWIVPATDIPAGVHPAFESEYITPLRQLQHWYTTIDDAITTLTEGGDGDDEISSADAVAKQGPLEDAIDGDIPTLARRLDRLSEIVDERTLSEVDQVGIVPADRSQLEQRLKRLIEDGDLEIEEMKSGVIVR